MVSQNFSSCHELQQLRKQHSHQRNLASLKVSLHYSYYLLLILTFPSFTSAQSVQSTVPFQSCNPFELETGMFQIAWFANGLSTATSHSLTYDLMLNRVDVGVSTNDACKVALGWYHLNKVYPQPFTYNNIKTVSRDCSNNLISILVEVDEAQSLYEIDITYLALSHDNSWCQILYFYTSGPLIPTGQTFYSRNVTVPTMTTENLKFIFSIQEIRMQCLLGNVNTTIQITEGALVGSIKHFDVEVTNANYILLWLSITYFEQSLLTSDTPTYFSSSDPIFQYELKRYTAADHGGRALQYSFFTSDNFKIHNGTFFVGLSGIQDNAETFNYQIFAETDPALATQTMLLDTSIENVYTELSILVTCGVNQFCAADQYFDQDAQSCNLCAPYCLQCDKDTGNCLSCYANYTLNAVSGLCQCLSPREFISALCVELPASLQNCKNAQYNDLTGELQCRSCSTSNRQSLSNQGSCTCFEGYAYSNASHCSEICGDGRVFYLDTECDDGNTASGDGCDSSCMLEEGFECKVYDAEPTLCQYAMDVSYEIAKIEKQGIENRAIMTLDLVNLFVPFPLLKEQFAADASRQPEKITLTVMAPEPTKIPLKLISISLETQQMALELSYGFSIESLNATLELDYGNTSYLSPAQSLEFEMIGSNSQLKVIENIETYQNISTSLLVSTVVSMFLLLVGLVSPKYIGLEAILTFQLIYTSQQLVADETDWPGEFEFLEYFRYAYGVPVFDGYTTYNSTRPYALKKQYLQVDKTLWENLHLNAMILVATFAAFLLICSYAYARERRFQQKQNKVGEAEEKEQRIIAKVRNFYKNNTMEEFQVVKKAELQPLKVSEVFYRIVNQISLWCVLQVLSALSAHFLIPNSDVTVVPENRLSFQGVANSWVCLSMVSIVALVGFNNFWNVFLSEITYGRLKRKLEELKYRRMSFVYLLVVGVLVNFFNDVEIPTKEGHPAIPMSAVVLTIHLIYMLVLHAKIKPYRLSIRVHTVGLLLNQFCYLVFLVCVNLINFLGGELPPMVILSMAYFITFSCYALILLSFGRLLMEWKYGEEFEIAQEEERKEMEETKRVLEIERQLRMIEMYQLEAKERMKKKKENEQSRARNVYLYENQRKEQEKEDMLFWLDSRLNWTKEQKERYFYKHFDEKPLEVIQKSKVTEYREIKKEIQQSHKRKKTKAVEREKDQQYQAVRARLSSEFREFNQKQKLYNDKGRGKQDSAVECVAYDETGQPIYRNVFDQKHDEQEDL